MQSIKDYYTSSTTARIITSILLLVALSNQQISYYKFLRWTVCVAAIYTAFTSYVKKEQRNLGVWRFGLIATLFNPIIPIYLGKNSWQKADMLLPLYLLSRHL